jgi:DNA-binding transcriptional MerR regulator
VPVTTMTGIPKDSSLEDRMGHGEMLIGELSRRSGYPIETIRYYERIGLLPAPARVRKYRHYGATDLERLAFVRCARALGFTFGTLAYFLETIQAATAAITTTTAPIAKVPRSMAKLPPPLPIMNAPPFGSVGQESARCARCFAWHRDCSVGGQPRSVTTLEGRRQSYPPDGGRTLFPARHVRRA